MADPLECSQPAVETVAAYAETTQEYEHFAPSCKEIPKDENLKYSVSIESFKENISNNTATDDNIPLFPEPHVFAHFSNIAYENEPIINTDLFPDWQVLTAASNSGQTSDNTTVLKGITGNGNGNTAPSNGYFGVAFWHPENHHLVIAHRGTDPKCIAALQTDYYGVIHNEYVWQIFSAATFALEVVKAFIDKDVHFQLFFTGHSLGGWLAQITTFTIKYLHVTETLIAGTSRNYFRLPQQSIESEEPTSVHAHTVVFDSPGCKPMLLKLADGFEVRYSGKIVQVNELDITNYMSAPNLINTRNAHVGTIYRLYPNIKSVTVYEERTGTSWINSFLKFKQFYKKLMSTYESHIMKTILTVFVTELKETVEESGNSTGVWGRLKSYFFRKPSQKKYNLTENIKISEVVDWPESNGICGGEEFDNYMRWAYGGDTNSLPLEYSLLITLPGCCTIRYQVKTPDKNKRSLNVFTQTQRDFLEQYQLIRTFQDVTDLGLPQKHQDLLSDYQIHNHNLHTRSSDPEKIKQLVAGVPFLLMKHENLSKQIRGKLTETARATFDYLKSIHQSNYSFNNTLEIVAGILDSKDTYKRTWEFTAEDTTAAFIRLVDSLKQEIFERSSSDILWRFTAVSFEKLMKLTKDQPQEFNEGHHLVVVNCGNLESDQREPIDTLKRQIENKAKLILICLSKSRGFGNCGISRWGWKDLSTDTKRMIMGKTIVLQGKHVGLSNILFNMGRPENLSEEVLNFECELKQTDIMDLMASDSRTVSVGGQPPRISELEAAFVKCGNSIADKNSVVNFIKSCDDENVHFIFTVLTPPSSSSSSLPVNSSSSGSSGLEEIKKLKCKNVKIDVKITPLTLTGSSVHKQIEEKFKKYCKSSKVQMAYWLSIIKDETETEVWTLEMIFDANFFVDRNTYRVAVNEFVRGNLSEFKFLNFQSAGTIRLHLNISHQVISDETLQNQMISQNEPVDDADLDTMKYILMSSEHFPKEFVLYQKPSQDNLDVFRGENIFLLVDEPGMGKSTTLVKLGEAEYESYWVVHISLRNCNSKETTAQNLLNFLCTV